MNEIGNVLVFVLIVFVLLSLATWTFAEGYTDAPIQLKPVMPTITTDDYGNFVDQDGNIIGPDNPNYQRLVSPHMQFPADTSPHLMSPSRLPSPLESPTLPLPPSDPTYKPPLPLEYPKLPPPSHIQVMPVIFADGTSQMISMSSQQQPPPMAWVPGPGEMNMGNIPPWMLPQVPGMGI